MTAKGRLTMRQLRQMLRLCRTRDQLSRDCGRVGNSAQRSSGYMLRAAKVGLSWPVSST